MTSAVALLDTEGAAGLTMRALARRLGQSPMALYHYVATREDLLELAVDRVFAEMVPAAPGPSGKDDGSAGARRRLEALGEAMFRAFLRHPWTAGVLGTTPPFGPHARENFRAVVEACALAGLDGAGLDGAVTAFYYYVTGAASSEATFALSGNPDTVADAVAWAAVTAGPPERKVLQHFQRMAVKAPGERFEAGLRTLLDGALGARTERGAKRPPANRVSPAAHRARSRPRS